MRMHTRSGKPFNNPVLGPTFSEMQHTFKSSAWTREVRFNRAWKSAEFLSISELGRNSSCSWLKGTRGFIKTRNGE